MDQRWTLEQLAILVERGLETAGCAVQNSGRVRALPDARTIRYYTTLGLLDPPAEMRGRRAFYRRSHLLQLVAIKRLQSRGLSLAHIQQSLVGITPRDLEKLAGLSSEFWSNVQKEAAATRPTTPEGICSQDSVPSPIPPGRTWRGQQQFWAKEPALDEAATPVPNGSDKPARAQCALHVQAGDGVELVLHGIDPNRLDREASARLQEIVERLARELSQLRLTSPPPSRQEEGGG